MVSLVPYSVPFSSASPFDAIDQLVTVDVNMMSILAPMYREIRNRFGDSPSKIAAIRISQKFAKTKTIMIVTGYPVPYPFSQKREVHSDGSIGVASLAKSLLNGLGVRSVNIVDEGLGKIQSAVLDSVGLSGEYSRVEEFWKNKDPIDQARSLLDTYNPSTIIASEKSSMNSDGIYHAALGDNLSDFVSQTDYIFLEAEKRGILTIGIGDFGNEIGMGLIKDSLREILPNSGRCKCDCKGGIIAKTSADCVLVGTMSDWGVYGLIAAIAVVARNPELVPTLSEVRTAMLAFAKQTGVENEEQLMTDNIPIASTGAVLEILSQIALSSKFNEG